MKKDWVLTQDAFDSLLDWLDADRERAAAKYETIRLRLIKIFVCRGCSEAEDLADETFNRVAARVREMANEYRGDPMSYFFGFPANIHREYLRKVSSQRELSSAALNATSEAAPDTSEDIEADYQCLESCLERLPGRNNYLVTNYYKQQGRAKIEHHKQLALELGISVNALRIRAHRIRLNLEQCVKECLAQLRGD